MNKNGSGTMNGGFGTGSDLSGGIQVIACVQGNTARSAYCGLGTDAYSDLQHRISVKNNKNNSIKNNNMKNRGNRKTDSHNCEVYYFSQHTDAKRNGATRTGRREGIGNAVRKSASAGRNRSGKKAVRSGRVSRKNGRLSNIQYALMGIAVALVITVFTGIGSRANSTEVPEAYKYYDTITVGYQENLLDIVQRYDDRNFYETQRDYVEELCMINNLPYSETEYPNIAPGTHLVVPYYSEELK